MMDTARDFMRDIKHSVLKKLFYSFTYTEPRGLMVSGPIKQHGHNILF